MNSDDLTQLIGAFMAEAQEFLQVLETTLLEIEAVPGLDARKDAVKTLFRAAHSLKGSASMFGFTELATAAHDLEDGFAILRDRADLSVLDAGLVTLLLEGVDHLKAVMATVQSGTAVDPAHLVAIASLKQQLEDTFGSEDSSTELTSNEALEQQVLSVIFRQDLPPILNQFETEISQAQPQTLAQTVETLTQIYRQLSGLAGMLQLPELGTLAGAIATLVDNPNLTVEHLQTQGWNIAQQLQTAREQVLQGRAIQSFDVNIPDQIPGQAPDQISDSLQLDATPEAAEDVDSLLDELFSAEALQPTGSPTVTNAYESNAQDLQAWLTASGADLGIQLDPVPEPVSDPIPELISDPAPDLVLDPGSDSFANLSPTPAITADFTTVLPPTPEPVFAVPAAAPNLEPAALRGNPSSPSPNWQRPTIRVDVEQLNQLVNLVGELVINRTNLELQEKQLRAEVKQIRQRIASLQNLGGHLREEYDRMTIPNALGVSSRTPGFAPFSSNGSKAMPALTSSNPNGLATVVLDRAGGDATRHFDALEMDQYTEFHTTAQSVMETTQAISQSATRIDQVSARFDRSTDQLRRISDQLRNRIMQLRVVPFSRAVDHLPRALRDLSRSHNKDVSLLLLGRETKIDESLLDALRDPLIHLVRNAFDHGIEPAAVRQQNGKSLNGQIEIEAQHQGGQTIITIRDDGQGINPEIVRQQLISKRLLPEEQAQALSVTELYDCLFLPGFSTSTTISDLSGRGVGLDVVRTNLERVRGTIKVDSEVGKGTSFVLKLPLMLSITQALLVQTHGNTVAIPMDAVEEILQIQASDIYQASNQPMLKWRDEFIRLQSLQELFHYGIPQPDGREHAEPAEIPVLILASSEGVVAIAVEQLLGHQEIVMKPLPVPLSKPYGISGSTVLGDGRVIMIMDVDDVIHPLNVQKAMVSSDLQVPSQASTDSKAKILVVDDAYTVRQLLSLTLSRAQYRVVQAKDGQEAWEQLQNGLDCDLVIADIEMPRMDGFELLHSIKSCASLAQIPVAMLTSRSGSKHRQLAMELGASQYFTKPFQEAQLLEAIAQLLQVSPPSAVLSR